MAVRSSSYTLRLWLARSCLTAVCVSSTLALASCGKGDPDENFRLWSNNEAGWEEMQAFVADTGNDAKLRARALEILTDEGGHPGEAVRIAQKAPDKVEVMMALQPALQKMLENPNTKKQGYGKRVLFDMMNVLPADKKAATQEMLAKWAFGDLKPDDSPARIKEKLEQRIRAEEIDGLGNAGVRGAEIMLSKGISRDQIMQYLLGVNTPESHAALINGLRRYHAIKNVRVSEGDLAAIQKADCIEGFLYWIELYQKLAASQHPDDKAAASQSIVVAIQWSEKEPNKAKIKAAWAAQVKPVMDKLLTGANCDDRWWAAQMLLQYSGVDGLTEVLKQLPIDTNYGQQEFANSDVKMQITDLCKNEIKGLGADVVRPVLLKSLKSETRLIEQIVAIRCLAALGDDASLAALRAVDKKENKIVDPWIVPQDEKDVTIHMLAQASADVVEFVRAVDKQAAEGTIDQATAKARTFYATYSFERQGKKLAAYAESRAAEKVAKDKAKEDKAKGGDAKAAPAPAPAADETAGKGKKAANGGKSGGKHKKGH
jgi:hypothetical protein